MAKKSQIQKFREAAREHEADEDEGKFNDALKRVAKAPLPKSEDSPKKPSR
jgi:hypothetical protein